MGIPSLSAMWIYPIYLVLHGVMEAPIAGLPVPAASTILYQTWYSKLEWE